MSPTQPVRHRLQLATLHPVSLQGPPQAVSVELDRCRCGLHASHLVEDLRTLTSGVHEVRDYPFGNVRVRLCVAHKWESGPAIHPEDEPDTCHVCDALRHAVMGELAPLEIVSVLLRAVRDALPGEDRFFRRFGR